MLAQAMESTKNTRQAIMVVEGALVEVTVAGGVAAEVVVVAEILAEAEVLDEEAAAVVAAAVAETTKTNSLGRRRVLVIKAPKG